MFSVVYPISNEVLSDILHWLSMAVLCAVEVIVDGVGVGFDVLLFLYEYHFIQSVSIKNGMYVMKSQRFVHIFKHTRKYMWIHTNTQTNR